MIKKNLPSEIRHLCTRAGLYWLSRRQASNYQQSNQLLKDKFKSITIFFSFLFHTGFNYLFWDLSNSRLICRHHYIISVRSKVNSHTIKMMLRPAEIWRKEYQVFGEWFKSLVVKVCNFLTDGAADVLDFLFFRPRRSSSFRLAVELAPLERELWAHTLNKWVTLALLSHLQPSVSCQLSETLHMGSEASWWIMGNESFKKTYWLLI